MYTICIQGAIYYRVITQYQDLRPRIQDKGYSNIIQFVHKPSHIYIYILYIYIYIYIYIYMEGEDTVYIIDSPIMMISILLGHHIFD